VDFGLSAEQRELTEAATAFARRELNQDLAKREDAGEFPRDAWRACAAFGIQGLPVPAELGGAGADILTTALVMEALGYGCRDNGLLFSLNAQLWSVELPLVTFGTPAQQQAYLPGLVSGDLIGGHAMTEPESGSDALSMRTRAERRGDHYLLNGTKQFITNAPVADVLLVYAAIQGRPGMAGLSAFLVDAATPGLMVSGGVEKMGLRTSPTGEVALTDCLVPVQNRLGPEGAAMAIFNSSMEWERSCLFASSVGAMRRQLDACVAYARTREQFGQPIGKFQALQHRMADMLIHFEQAKSMAYLAAMQCEATDVVERRRVLSAAKALIGQSARFIGQQAVQLHGGMGMADELDVSHLFRRLTAMELTLGDTDHHLESFVALGS
jgi:alkylation response protein AidB-like acyl-CoA dehydrogenase